MDLHLVIIRNFYNLTDSSEAVDLFGKTSAMKIAGYRSRYAYGALPVATNDYFSDHLIVCTKIDNEFQPLITYKSVAQSTCEKFKGTLPINIFFEDENSHHHKEFLNRESNKAKAQGKEIYYDSGLTINRKLMTRDIDYTAQIKAMHTYYHTHVIKEPHITFAAGTVAFKMERYYEFLGYDYFTKDGENLPPVKAPQVHNDLTNLFVLHKPSAESIMLMKSEMQKWVSITVYENKEEEELIEVA